MKIQTAYSLYCEEYEQVSIDEFKARYLGAFETQDGFCKAHFKKNNPELYEQLKTAKLLKFFDFEAYFDSLPLDSYYLEGQEKEIYLLR